MKKGVPNFLHIKSARAFSLCCSHTIGEMPAFQELSYFWLDHVQREMASREASSSDIPIEVILKQFIW